MAQLVILSKTDDKGNVIVPYQQRTLCAEHFEVSEENFEGYKIEKVESDMTRLYCENCLEGICFRRGLPF